MRPRSGRRPPARGALLVALLPLLLSVACGPRADGSSSGDQGRGRGGGPPGGFGGAPAEATAIPVEVEPVVRRDVASYLETNGTLEAENEVDIVARIGGPVVELRAEEGQFFRQGELLARIDPVPIQAELALREVDVDEARMAFERAEVSWQNQIISREAYDTAKARLDAAEAQIRATRIQLEYTEIRAPFDGQIVERAIKYAEYVSPNQKLFRISDFTPLLCPIQVPEKDLSKLALGQPAWVSVESFPGERFSARVLRVSPVVEAGTGTVKVTLAVDQAGRLRPGMFASVFLEIDRRQDTLVIPKRALVLESIGDTVYVLGDGVAVRRQIELGYSEGDFVEVRTGLEAGERVIVIGQDAVSDGTPVYVLAEAAAPPPAAGFPGFGAGEPTPEQREAIRERMRQRGMSDEEIERVLSRAGGAGGGGGTAPRASGDESSSAGTEAAESSGTGGAGPTAPESAASGGPPGAGPRGFPPGFDPTSMTPEQEQRIRERMRERGLSEEQIDERLRRMKAGELGPPGGGGPPPR